MSRISTTEFVSKTKGRRKGDLEEGGNEMKPLLQRNCPSLISHEKGGEDSVSRRRLLGRGVRKKGRPNAIALTRKGFELRSVYL